MALRSIDLQHKGRNWVKIAFHIFILKQIATYDNKKSFLTNPLPKPLAFSSLLF